MVGCEVCGVEGTGTLCPSCGKIVCLDCFEVGRKCIKCFERDATNKRIWGGAMLGIGLLFLVIGLSIIASGIVLRLPVEEVTIAFPFLAGKVNTTAAATYSFLFFMTVACASLLPWIIHARQSNIAESWVEYTVSEEQIADNDGFEHTEYMITLELPKKLERTIRVETRPSNIFLWSTNDSAFTRSYPIPEGHDIEGIDYDYEDGYLVLRLHLVRIH